jgi:vacuolar-type H+-ATPase subunit F/Vma7
VINVPLRVVCTPSVSAGFALAGVPTIEVAEVDTAASSIAELGARETGVLLVEDTLYEQLPDELRRTLRRRALPIVVPFPGPSWARRDVAVQYIVEILRRAIGYQVRIR